MNNQIRFNNMLASLYRCIVVLSNLKPAIIMFQIFITMAKQVYECNWAPSRVTEEQLNNYVKTGALAKKDVIHWRVPGPENAPIPKDGEVVVFADHLN